MSVLHTQWKYWLLAVGFFTRLPVPAVADFHEADLNHAARYFPLVGWLVGGIAALVWWLARHWLPNDLAVLCSMAASIYCTGAFHEDGLADSADGIGGGMDKARMLAIMQDSRLGTYGAVSLIGILFFKFHALLALPEAMLPFAMWAGHALSRLSAVVIMTQAHYVRFSGKSKPIATRLSGADLVWATMFGLLPCGIFLCSISMTGEPCLPFLLSVTMPVLLVWYWWWRLIMRNLQGYTGDTLGACQQFSELAMYLGLVIWQRL